MKHILIFLFLVAAATTAKAQENIVILNGGYAFITGQEVNADLTGWRINGVYEFNPMGGPISHGLAFGYANATGPSTAPGDANIDIEIGTWPIYYQPKYTFGNEQIQGFVKGAAGWQWSNLTRTGPVLKVSDNNGGFYGGAGAGFVLNIKPNLFIQAEYEIAWMSNYNYNDGWLNSAMGGIGFRF